ncbi:MAG: flavodoxin family protein [Promethearchaeota archaeon]
MKIVAINGSHRGAVGYTQFLIDKIFAGAKENGAICESIPLASYKIERCLGCNHCQSKDGLLNCVYSKKDDVAAILKKIEEADLVIYATPVYIFNISGLLKIFFERFYGTSNVQDLKITESGLLFHHVNKKLNSKPFIALICSDNIERKVIQTPIVFFKRWAQFLDAPLAGMLTCQGGILTGHGVDKEKEKQFLRIFQVYKALTRAGVELALKGKISSTTQKEINQQIIPIPRLVFNLKPIKKKILKIAKKMLKN